MNAPGMDLPETVRYEPRTPGVRLLTLDRPEAMNAIGPVEARGLFEALAAFRDDPDASVLVITGTGPDAFCAGADLAAVTAMFDPEAPASRLLDPSDPDAHPIPADGNIGPTRWTGINKPIIAAVNGAAYAGGLEWACLAHLRVADQHASFGVTCRRWNVGLGDGGTQRLPRLVGLSRALDLIITGRVIGTSEAERIGLVNEVTASGQCVTRALELAERIAALPQPALRTDLEATMRGSGRPLDEGLRIERECFNRLLDEPELADGARQFIERDHPDREAAAPPLHLPGAAFGFATRAHAGQPGPYGQGEFIDHVARVAQIVADAGGDDLAVSGAYLKDVSGTAGVDLQEIEFRFGRDVAILVGALNEDESIGDRDARREEHRQRIAQSGTRPGLAWMADRLAAVEALAAAFSSGTGPEPAETVDHVSAWRRDLELAASERIAPEIAVRAAEALDRIGSDSG